MPNISYCQLSINLPLVEFYEDWSGSQAKRQERWDMMKKLRDELDEHGCDHEMILNILRPEPKNLGDDWYWWRAHNWGTKWARIIDYDLQPDLHLVQFTLETAWGPPLEICKYITDELGFEVRCVWSSYENSDWGVWEYGDIAGRAEVERYDEDNFKELHDLLDDYENRESKLEYMMTLAIFGGSASNYISDHDREWIIAEWRGIFESQLEEYEEWLENQPDQISLMKLKQEALNHTEKLLEKGEITEGDYLKMCNKLKKITYEQLNLVIKAASGPQMIDYYKKGGEEPKLIDCY